jgi:Na+:H+ antiporter, NhaA family
MTVSQSKINRIRHHIITPLRFFFNDSRSTGLLLIACTIFSLFLANSSLGPSYTQFFSGSAGSLVKVLLPGSLTGWINNFLMSFFFLFAASEIKRELITGELATYKKAILPIGAAFGGMIVPALIFAIFCFHSNYGHGWGIPTATDIAFSLAAASLLGKRFPVGLKILLMALAIIDDLGAIAIIAFFYGGTIHWLFLGITLLIIAALFFCNYRKVKFGPLQVILGFCLWFTVMQSGIEASITGVFFAFALPVDALASIEKSIHKFVNFGVLPLFALANTATLIPSNIIGSLNTPVGMGIITGLVIGKPVGIFLASRIMVALRIAQLPGNVSWKEYVGMGTLAGIGFTMSIFTTLLAFQETRIRDISKIAILTSALASVLLSFLYYKFVIGIKGSGPVKKPQPEIPGSKLNLSRV